MRNRKEQRRLRKAREEKLELRDFCGIRDPTPYEAVKHIIQQEQKGGDPPVKPERTNI